MIRLSGVSGGTSSRRRSDTTPTRCRRRVDDVEVEDHLHVARGLQRRDRFGRRHVFRKREDFRVHDAAGGLLGVLEQVADVGAGRLLLHQLQHRGRELFRQVVDDRRHVVGRQLLRELDDLLGGAAGEQRRARLRPELAQGLHRQPAVAFDEQGERRAAILVGQLGEELRQVGGVLLLEQIDEVRRRPHALEALDGVEHDVELALGHRNCPM